MINISTLAIYMWSTMTPERPSYGLTKSAGTTLLQQIAKDVKPQDLQIISLHPGCVLSDMAQAAGLDENTLKWDDGEPCRAALFRGLYPLQRIFYIVSSDFLNLQKTCRVGPWYGPRAPRQSSYTDASSGPTGTWRR